jgi:aldose sugar dehydrogenase
VANENERGMLGIAVSVENDTTTYMFVYFTESGGGEDIDDSQGVPPSGNRLYRYELQGNELVNPELLLDLPALPGPRYNGGPIAIGPDDNVYVINGDLDHHETKVQNFEDGPTADGSSGVLRVGKNGELPEPVIGTSTFGKYYFAYGICNSFGMAFDPETGNLWDTENGPAFGDEVNLVEEGFNGGWRKVQGVANVHSPDSDLEDLVLFNARSHYRDPEFTWTEPIGVTGLAFLNSSNLGEEYQNDMFVGDFNGAIYHFKMNETRTGFVLDGDLADKVADTPEESEALVFGLGFGRITDIKTGPDGNLYVVSFIDSAIYKVVHEGDSNNNNDNRTGNEEERTPHVAIPPEEDEENNDSNTAQDHQSGTAYLTVNSADLSNNTIIGMFTTISSSNGTVLQEGYTPLTFTGKEGSTYTTTVSDCKERDFNHWDNGATDRTITLDRDTTLTAYYEIHKKDVINSQNTLTNNNDNRINENGLQHRIENTIHKIIEESLNNKGPNIHDRIDKLVEQLTKSGVDHQR